jgi:hypothetical protein
LIGLEGFDLAGDDVVDSYWLSGSFRAFPQTKPSDDVNGTPDFQLIEILDVFAFHRSDVMPGGLDDRHSFLRGVAVIGVYAEFGATGVATLLDVDSPEIANEFDFVQMFHRSLVDDFVRYFHDLILGIVEAGLERFLREDSNPESCQLSV